MRRNSTGRVTHRSRITYPKEPVLAGTPAAVVFHIHKWRLSERAPSLVNQLFSRGSPPRAQRQDSALRPARHRHQCPPAALARELHREQSRAVVPDGRISSERCRWHRSDETSRPVGAVPAATRYVRNNGSSRYCIEYGVKARRSQSPQVGSFLGLPLKMSPPAEIAIGEL